MGREVTLLCLVPSEAPTSLTTGGLHPGSSGIQTSETANQECDSQLPLTQGSQPSSNPDIHHYVEFFVLYDRITPSEWSCTDCDFVAESKLGLQKHPEVHKRESLQHKGVGLVIPSGPKHRMEWRRKLDPISTGDPGMPPSCTAARVNNSDAAPRRYPSAKHKNRYGGGGVENRPTGSYCPGLFPRAN
ncbi:hypothetical protein TNIN_354071 [Trichonephila inaurata madagascariensis]|uniref:Uncharacterized protein n=1 Tax=Trichonephila inaurata madagascariensis TaxID=2747483 RepID=A0A8X6XMU8_9ARAC|nr:hypothetical protein TNIN_354071 [Trichonephila inaurata madagascariensis]